MEQKDLIIKILNSFEVGKAATDYSTIYIYHDGPGKKRQVTLGRGYTECGGALWDVFTTYKQLGGGNADKLLEYKKSSCEGSLPNNKEFLDLITSTAKEDPKFRQAEDSVYDKQYWNHGQTWFDKGKFTKLLSMAVIQDSMLQSGSVPTWLCNRFPNKTPINGGDEEAWVKAYIKTRDYWLAHHSNPILNGTVYRTRFFLQEIAKDNWNLDQFPIYPNDVKIIS